MSTALALPPAMMTAGSPGVKKSIVKIIKDVPSIMTIIHRSLFKIYFPIAILRFTRMAVSCYENPGSGETVYRQFVCNQIADVCHIRRPQSYQTCQGLIQIIVTCAGTEEFALAVNQRRKAIVINRVHLRAAQRMIIGVFHHILVHLCHVLRCMSLY